jgi:hypothetical protein
LLAKLAENDVEIGIKEKEVVVIEIGGKGPLKIPVENAKSLETPILKEDNAEIVLLEKAPLVMELNGEEILKMMEEHIKILDATIVPDRKEPKKYVRKRIGDVSKAKINNVRGKRYGR